jgi:hypothetical protein
MSGLFLKCADCGGLARPIPSTPGVLACTCGRVRTPLPIPPVDLASVRQLSMNALIRARAMVYAVPVTGSHGEFTLSADRSAVERAGLARDVAENYAAAVNGEAELARSMLNVLAELERLRCHMEALRDQTLADRGSSEIGGRAASNG